MFFHGGFFILGILFLVIVAPIWIILHYITQWRNARRLSGADEKTLGDLWQSARRMEGRIDALEKVLDSEAPGWRMRAGG
ncbi:MAG TPA: envelope stress response membrane protein PspB [Stellaceae bacterium]|jgi:phage shock protein B|nr:envelope stress response membrane protein PspB [Stellaceae bacterium]